MFRKIRYDIASCLTRKALNSIEKGDIKKGLKYLKRSVAIVPYSTELEMFGVSLRETAEKYGQ